MGRREGRGTWQVSGSANGMERHNSNTVFLCQRSMQRMFTLSMRMIHYLERIKVIAYHGSDVKSERSSCGMV